MKIYEVKVHDNGCKEWYLDGKLHREDGPAAEYPYGTKKWFLNGELHREDGPAAEYHNGTKEWWVYGKRHREDGPAVEHPDGRKKYYLNGELHREDGPAIEDADGRKEWWVNGTFNRRCSAECPGHKSDGQPKELTQEQISEIKRKQQLNRVLAKDEEEEEEITMNRTANHTGPQRKVSEVTWSVTYEFERDGVIVCKIKNITKRAAKMVADILKTGDLPRK